MKDNAKAPRKYLIVMPKKYIIVFIIITELINNYNYK